MAFDFDGTLVDSNHIKRQGFFEIAERFTSGKQSMEAILEKDAGDRYWVFKEFVSSMLLDEDAMSLANSYTQFCEDKIVKAPEISGASTTLAKLKEEGKFLFVNSATPVEPLMSLIRLRQMEKWFKGIYGAPKKKQENLEIIKSKHNLRSDEVLVVGDGESDRVAAELVGCHFIGIGKNENNFLHMPSYLIDNLESLPTAILSLESR